MPAIRAPVSRVLRHFSPLTVHTTFKKERLSNPPPIAYSIVYPLGPHSANNRAANPFAIGTPAVKAHIEKPSGEVTRLARGGYNLQAELKWADDFYQECQKTLAQIAGKLLDESKTWPAQKAPKKKEFLKAAMKEITILAEYKDCWPASDFMVVHLKNTKQRVKNLKTKQKGKEKADDKEDDSEDEEEEEEEGE